MASELHKPLKGREPKGRSIFRDIISLKSISACLLGFSLLGLSLHSMLSSGNMGRVSTAPNIDTSSIVLGDVLETSQPKNLNQKQSLGSQSGLTGANISKNEMPDGSIVSVYSPGQRDGDPVLMSTSRYGQALQAAYYPNEDLIEDSPFGLLPKIASDGLRPIEQYARPWSGARGTRIAIVVGGLGLSQTGTQKAISELPSEITLGFAATGHSLQRWMQEARREGHEILLQVPFEPFGYPSNNPGEDTLLLQDTNDVNLERLHRSMAKITNYTGIMNYLGARYMANNDAMKSILSEIGGRGLLFLDDGSSAQTTTISASKITSTPTVMSDLILDDQVNELAILRKLDDLERIARRNGTAVGVASAFDESVAAIARWVDEASSRGIEIVGVSALALEDVQ